MGGSEVRLYRADSVEALPIVLDPGSVDVVVTSPPYNRGVPYGVYDDRRPREEYLDWIGQLAQRVRGVLADDGSFFLNVGGAPKDPWLPWDVAREVGRRFVLQNVIHWVKSIVIERRAAGESAGLDRDLAVGHYKPLKSARYLHGAHEYIFHFTPTGDVAIDRLAVGIPYQDKSNVGRWKRAALDRRCRGNTWFLPYATIQRARRDRPHPASFPPELPAQCYKLHGVERIRLAVDPFVGIGPAAVAAAELGLPFIGFDLDPGYLDVAARHVDAVSAVAPATSGSRQRRGGGPRIK